MNKLIMSMFLMGAMLSAGALAQQQAPQKYQPYNIQRRQRRQQKRIANGVNSGQLTPKETARIETRETRLNKEIRHDRQNGLNPQERQQIRNQQDKLSREIYHEKHDEDRVPPAK